MAISDVNIQDQRASDTDALTIPGLTVLHFYDNVNPSRQKIVCTGAVLDRRSNHCL